jgi:hypothetical protein
MGIQLLEGHGGSYGKHIRTFMKKLHDEAEGSLKLKMSDSERCGEGNGLLGKGYLLAP